MKRNYKRLGTYVMILVLISSLFIPGVGVVAEGDSTPPKLNDLTISSTKVGPGEFVKLSAEIIDDLSGVQSAYINYKTKNGLSEKSISLYRNPETGKYDGIFEVGKYDAEGIWSITSISLFDNQHNSYTYINGKHPEQTPVSEYKDLTSYDIFISGTISDLTPPTVNDLIISQHNAGPGDTVTITADIRDDLSGVNSAEILYRDPAGKGYKIIPLSINTGSGRFQGRFEVSKYDAEGIWKIDWIRVIDNQNNYFYYQSEYQPEQGPIDLSSYDILISGTITDENPPILSDIMISQSEVDPGDNVKITADVIDELSGVNSVYMIYISPNGKGVKNITLSYNINTGKFEGYFKVGPYESEGTWTIGYIVVVDNQNIQYTYQNGTEYYKSESYEIKDLSNCNIKVSYNAPITVIQLEADIPMSGEFYTSDVNVSLNSTDNQTNVEATFFRINGGEWNLYEGPFKLIEDGKIFIDYKSVDSEGNEEPVKSTTVKIDKTAPKTTPNLYDRNKYITLYATDNHSGVKKIEYRIDNGDWNVYTGPISLDKYEEKRYILETRSMDYAGNVEEIKSQEFIIDRTAPTTSILGLEDQWFNTDVTFSISAYDALSGIYFSEFKFNQEQWKLYEAPITVTQEGVNYFYYRSIDNFKNFEELKTAKVMIDKTAPTLNVSFNQSVITDRSHKFIPINATVDVEDELSGFAAFELVSIVSNQAEDAKGSGNTLVDIEGAEYGTPDTEFSIRAERTGKEDRVYSVTYKATDKAGNEVFITEKITVKHDNSSK